MSDNWLLSKANQSPRFDTKLILSKIDLWSTVDRSRLSDPNDWFLTEISCQMSMTGCCDSNDTPNLKIIYIFFYKNKENQIECFEKKIVWLLSNIFSILFKMLLNINILNIKIKL